ALGRTTAIRQRLLNYLQRLILILPFDALHTTRFSSCKTPVETFTTPCLKGAARFLLLSLATLSYHKQSLSSSNLHLTYG
ncbi:MAG: hypothetical protein IKK33_17755, partial [Lachnospiraceae bacterium]|nr:hypothetical protein [Lachnospiraceae bacterium]